MKLAKTSSYNLHSQEHNNITTQERKNKHKNLRSVNKTMSSSKSSSKLVVPEAREAMNKFKMEAANEVGVNLKQGYNGDLTSRQAGSIGGQMVKKMIESYEKSVK